MTKSETRRYIADQIGVDAIHLSALLDTFAPTTLADWAYITGQLGHTSPQELREACIRHGAQA